MKYTIKSIAEELNLSRNTVAKVLSQKSGVSPKTTRLVLDHIQALKDSESISPAPLTGTAESITASVSSPDTSEDIAASVSSPDTTESRIGTPVILLLLPEDQTDLTFRFDLIRTVKQTLAACGFRLLVDTVSARDLASTDLPSVLQQPFVKGILISGIYNADFFRSLLQRNLPTAALLPSGAFPDEALTPSGTSPKTALTLSSTIPDAASPSFHEYAEFMGLMNLFILQKKAAVDKILTMVSSDSQVFFLQASQWDHLEQMLTAPADTPKVFVCENDSLAIRLLKTARHLNLRIPEDVSVIGFGNIPESSCTFPALTTLQNPLVQMASAAARQLADQITDPATACICTQYIPALISRESTCF